MASCLVPDQRKVMVVRMPKCTWAGDQPSPVVWRQVTLPGEYSLASEGKRPLLVDWCYSQYYGQDRKGSTEMCFVSDANSSDWYLHALRFMWHCVWKHLTYRRHLSIWRISRQIWLSQKLFQEMKNLVITNETCILSSMKQIASRGWMHETSAQGWCTGKTQREGMGREVGGGIRMGNTCKSMADSCQWVAKPTTIL